MSTELVPVTAVKPRRNLKLRLFAKVQPKRGRRRVWDRLMMLERDLAHAQQLNLEQAKLIEQLQAELDSAGKAAWNAIDRADELDRKLQLAIEANEANSHRVDFIFPDRPMDGPEDVATQPVPMIVAADPVVEKTQVFPAVTQVRLVNPVKVGETLFGAVKFPAPPPYVPRITVGNSPMAGTDPTHTVASTVVMKKVTVDE